MSDIRKILNTLTEMTSGSVASVSMPLTTQRRQDHVDENDAKSQSHDVLEYGNWENSALTTSKKLKQTRSKAKKLVKKIYGEDTTTESMDGVSPSTKMFTSEGKTKNPVAKAAQRVAKGSGKHKNPAKVLPRKAKHKKMYEEEITEQDLIISPVIRRGRDRDLISRDHSRIDREVEMARGDVHQAQQNAAKILAMIQDRSEQEGLEGWVQEKIIKASDYLNTVREYLENREQEQGVAEGSVDSKYPHGEVKYRIVYRKSGEKVEGVNSFASKADAQQYAAKDPQYSVQAYRVKEGVAEGSDHDDDYSTASFEKWKKQKEYEKEYDKKKPAKPIVPDNKDKKKGVEEGLTKRARAKKEAESVKAVIARLEQELKDTNPHIDKDDIHRRLETEKRRLELYRDVLDDKDVTEGFSDVVKGIKRFIKGKEHPNVVSSKHAGRAIGHYNQGDIPAGDKETERYVKTRDMHLKAKGVAEGSDQFLVYISVDRVEAFEDWMNSEGLETNVPKTDEGTYVVYDYSNADHRSKMYAGDWNEKKGVAEGSDQELVRRQGSYWDQVAKEKKEQDRKARKAKKAEYEETPAGKAEKYWSQKDVAEDLDANQKSVGQLGPTEKIGKRGTRGRLVGGN